MPDVSSGVESSGCAVGRGYLDFFEDAFGGCYLVGTHDKQEFFGGEYAVAGDDGEQGVFFAEGLCEVCKVLDVVVFGVCPAVCEFEAVGGFLYTFSCSRGVFSDVAVSCGVGVVFGVCSVGDDEYLDEFEEPGACPEAFVLVAVYLVEGFF